MAIQTFPYRVRAGAQLAHEGTVLEGGAPVQLTRAVAVEVRHLVEPLDADGNPIDPPSELQLEIEERPAHERDTILQRKRAELVGHLVELQEVADRTKATAAAAQQDVDDLQAAIADVDAKLAAPAVETKPEPPRARVRVAKVDPEQTNPAPAAPAVETKE